MIKKKNENVYPVEGVKLASIYSKMYKKRRYDLSIIELCKEAIVSGVFTENKAKAAPVIISKNHIRGKNLKYLIINSGNANAGTGEDGIKDIKKYCRKISDLTSCNFKDILVFSTGVIGERIKANFIVEALPKLIKRLDV